MKPNFRRTWYIMWWLFFLSILLFVACITPVNYWAPGVHKTRLCYTCEVMISEWSENTSMLTVTLVSTRFQRNMSTVFNKDKEQVSGSSQEAESSSYRTYLYFDITQIHSIFMHSLSQFQPKLANQLNVFIIYHHIV